MFEVQKWRTFDVLGLTRKLVAGRPTVLTSNAARCLKVGGRVHEKPDLPEAVHERRTREFGGESGELSLPPEK